LLAAETGCALLVNFGGDLTARGPRRNGSGWTIGIEDPRRTADPHASAMHFELERGGVATSGDSRRYFCSDGVRYSHILDPRTGWPVPEAPRSVTVVAGTCIEAGMLATLAMLHGPGAERFLAAQGLRYWCLR
jgi:thiamine biosynthesis lipoprotein